MYGASGAQFFRTITATQKEPVVSTESKGVMTSWPPLELNSSQITEHFKQHVVNKDSY